MIKKLDNTPRQEGGSRLQGLHKDTKSLVSVITPVFNNKDTIENKASSVTKKILDNKVVQEGVKEIQKTENQKAMGEKFENLLENSTKTLEKIDVNLDNKK